MSDEQTSQPAAIVGGPVEASPVDGHMTFGYRIKREEATRDVSVYVPATCLEADPASLDAPMRRIIASRGRSALEEQLARGGWPESLWIDADGSCAEA
ncbi:MAG TPA: hypothetical protein VH025_01025 [Solirubrobacteraceae bacterium]|jgi:hypothetical protein|nr:hypothetical protein [Solirubrobacteraceae bacterium]